MIGRREFGFQPMRLASSAPEDEAADAGQLIFCFASAGTPSLVEPASLISTVVVLQL
jgi:hypothetical protein